MAKPPVTPPSSDIDGVDEDRVRIDHPANRYGRNGQTLDKEEQGNDAKPKPSRA